MAYLATTTTFLQFADIHFSPRVLLAAAPADGVSPVVAALLLPHQSSLFLFSFLVLFGLVPADASQWTTRGETQCYTSTLPLLFLPLSIFYLSRPFTALPSAQPAMDANECIPSHCHLDIRVCVFLIYTLLLWLPQHRHHHHHHLTQLADCLFHFTLGSAWSKPSVALPDYLSLTVCSASFTFVGLVISCSHSNDWFLMLLLPKHQTLTPYLALSTDAD